jgi:SHAQKYF class myb-like DNA-binding protein
MEGSIQFIEDDLAKSQSYLDKKRKHKTPKRRIVWTPSLHKRFVEIVHRLGAKAVPKKILKEMGVEGLTRENIASHLQVWTLYTDFVGSLWFYSEWILPKCLKELW